MRLPFLLSLAVLCSCVRVSAQDIVRFKDGGIKRGSVVQAGVGFIRFSNDPKSGISHRISKRDLTSLTLASGESIYFNAFSTDTPRTRKVIIHLRDDRTVTGRLLRQSTDSLVLLAGKGKKEVVQILRTDSLRKLEFLSGEREYYSPVYREPAVHFLPYRRLQLGILLGSGTYSQQSDVIDAYESAGFGRVTAGSGGQTIVASGLAFAPAPTQVRLHAAYRLRRNLQLSVQLPLQGNSFTLELGRPMGKPDFDLLKYSFHLTQGAVLFDYVFLPYPRRQRTAFEAQVSCGIGFDAVNEEFELQADSGYQWNARRRTGGLRGVFGFTGRLHLNRIVSIVPLQLQFDVPVLRPAFKEQVIRYPDERVRVSSYNYYPFGASIHWGVTFHLLSQ
jgi:hypothetical protein